MDELQTYSDLYKRLKLKIELLLGADEDKEKELDKIERGMLLENSPKLFFGKNSIEVKYEKEFEKVCCMLSQFVNNSIQEIKNMSMMSFYCTMEAAKDRAKDLKNK